MTGRQDFYYASSFTDPLQKQPLEAFCKKKEFFDCEISQENTFVGVCF